MVRKMLDVDVSKRASIEEVCELARMMKIKTDKQRQERRARQAEAAAKKAAGQRSAEAEQQADREGKTTSSSPSTPKRGVAEANEVEGKTQLRSSRKKPKKSTKDYVGAGVSYGEKLHCLDALQNFFGYFRNMHDTAGTLRFFDNCGKVHHISGTQGGQQGDPLEMLRFCHTIHPL